VSGYPSDRVSIGLVQAHHDTAGAEPVEVHKKKAIEKHVRLIREAAQRGAKIVCLQELFYGPYFCTEQNPKWYDATEAIPDGPTTRQMQDLAKELGIYDAVNVGAAGTLVVRKPGLRAKFLAELRRKLPFEATIAFCDGRDLIRLQMDDPVGTEPPPADVDQFVSILSEAGRRGVSLPIALPEGEEWLVRIIGRRIVSCMGCTAAT